MVCNYHTGFMVTSGIYCSLFSGFTGFTCSYLQDSGHRHFILRIDIIYYNIRVISKRTHNEFCSHTQHNLDFIRASPHSLYAHCSRALCFTVRQNGASQSYNSHTPRGRVLCVSLGNSFHGIIFCDHESTLYHVFLLHTTFSIHSIN